MPDTVKSLRIENDSLKAQISALRKDFLNLEHTLKSQEKSTSDNGCQGSSRLDDETRTNLEFYSKSYDELNSFRSDASEDFKRLNYRLNDLAKKVDEIAEAIENIQRYSYQYVKIIGIPEINASESALITSTLCIKLFSALGVEATAQDIDIAHRIPTRNTNNMPRPIVCKFARWIVKEQVMNVRKGVDKIKATDIGLPSDSYVNTARIFDHLTPQVQNLLSRVKKFQVQVNYSFCWTKNFNVFLRQTEASHIIKIKSQHDLERLLIYFYHL